MGMRAATANGYGILVALAATCIAATTSESAAFEFRGLEIGMPILEAHRIARESLGQEGVVTAGENFAFWFAGHGGGGCAFTMILNSPSPAILKILPDIGKNVGGTLDVSGDDNIARLDGLFVQSISMYDACAIDAPSESREDFFGTFSRLYGIDETKLSFEQLDREGKKVDEAYVTFDGVLIQYTYALDESFKAIVIRNPESRPELAAKATPAPLR